MGLGGGAAAAAGLSLFALIIAVLSLFSRESLFKNFAIGYVIAAYWTGGLIVGAIVGLLRPFARWPLGAMLIGIPCAAAIYGSIMVAIMFIEQTGVQVTREGTRDLSLHAQLWLLFSIGVVVGPVGALYFRSMDNGVTLRA